MRDLILEKEKWSVTALALTDNTNSLATSVASDTETLYSCSKRDAENCITQLAVSDSTASQTAIAQSKAYLAAVAFKNWKSDRESNRLQKTGAGIQSFLCTVGEFLQGFSGIAEIVKAADQQFGGLAYGTIILLATVAVNKQRREDAIEEILVDITHDFPRLNTLQEVWPKPGLQKLILEVFELAIILCREIIKYFTTSSGGRVKKAINPKELKMKTMSQLRKKLVEVRKECEVIVLEALRDTRMDLKEVRAQLEEIRATNKDIQIVGRDTNSRVQEHQVWMRSESDTKTREAYLSDLRRRLKFNTSSHMSITDSTAKVTTILHDQFSGLRRRRKRGKLLSHSMLMGEKTFSKWFETSKSSVLVLGGSNWVDDSAIQLNWLSYASTWVTTSAQPSRCTLAYFCQTDYRVTKRQARDFLDVMRSLIYQLAMQSPLATLPHIEDLVDITPLALQDRGGTVALENMAQLMVKFLETCDKNSVITIVIDRLDQCRWSDNPDAGSSTLETAVESLLDVVRHTSLDSLKIRVLLVMDEGPARKIARHFRSWTGRGLEAKADWNQEEEHVSDE